MKLVKSEQSRYSFALIFSLILHALTFGYVYKTTNSTNSPMTEKRSSKSINTVKLDSVKFITQEQLKAIKAANNQIVANELNGKKERPVNSRFAGERDQTFDRQTMAAANGAFKKAGLGAKESTSIQKTESAELPAKLKKMAKINKTKATAPKALSLSDLGTIEISKIENEEKIQEAALEEMNRNLASESKKAAAQGIARGSSDETGFSRNNDFVEEVPLGDMTNLNTTEFKYYGFYHRIRQKLEQYWGSTIQSKAKNLYKSGRRLPASENLITAITVILDDRGQILDIKIDGTSGVRELDQAAIESFNKAGPFPNPPKGLLIGGRAVIQWGFVVKS
ncbi:MAG: cell envelope integrity protein TolA [Bacteriovorax sp.]|jgi:protein TonB